MADKAKEAAAGGQTKEFNKMGEVRKALKKLGYNAKPLVILEYLKSTVGLEMEPAMISSYKSQILKGLSKKGRLVRKAKEAPAIAPAKVEGKGISVRDVRLLRELADRLGADKVRELTELVSR